MFKGVGTFFRTLRTGWVLVRHDAFVPAEYDFAVPAPVRVFGKISRVFSKRSRADNPGERFAAALESLGPAYIKFGQVLATRGDMFDADFARGLSRLKDKVPPFPQEIAEQTLAREWGVPWDKRLTTLSEPIAAASVAQVHKATLPSGETVAVKILRPNIVERMRKDMATIAFVAKGAHKFVPNVRRLRPIDFVAEANRAVMLELDLRLEAAATSELGDIATETGLFRVPKIYWDMVDKNIMVTEWIDGIAMSSPDVLTDPNIDKKALARQVIQSFLASTFQYGVFHADMHEGNMIVAPDGQLVLIDFGILGRLRKEDIRFEIETLHGFLQRDYIKIAQVHFDIGYVPDHYSVEDFASALRAVGEPIFGKKAEDVSMSKVLMQLLEITELFDMQLQPQLILLQKTMMQTEGVARRLDPEFDMWEASRDIVEKAAFEELGPQRYLDDFIVDARRLQKAMRDVPDAVENLAALSKAWVAGEVDLSPQNAGGRHTPSTGQGSDKPRKGWGKFALTTGFGAALAVAALYATNML